MKAEISSILIPEFATFALERDSHEEDIAQHIAISVCSMKAKKIIKF